MKKILLLCLLLTLISIAASYSQDKEEYYFEGIIDKYPIEMYIYKTNYDPDSADDTGYAGYYVYNNHMIPLLIYQKLSGTHTFDLIHYTQDNEDHSVEIFSGIITNNLYKGFWTKGDKKLSFVLIEKKPKVNFVNKNSYQKFHLKNLEDIYGTYTAHFMLPARKDISNIIMGKISENKTYDFNQYSQKSGEEFKNYYFEEFSEYEFEEEETYFMYRYSSTEYLSPYLNTEKYLIMQHLTHYYLGGAHGIYSSKYLNYSYKKNNIIELRDILDISYRADISKIIKDCIRKKHNIPVNSKLDEYEESAFISDDVDMPEVFTIHKDGLIFYFSLYELTAYAYGEYSIFVPYEELIRYLNPEFEY